MKAIALISGGLDSILAARIIKDQGINIIPVNFNTPFYQENQNKHKSRNLSNFVMACLGEKLKLMDINEEYLSLILNPEHGFGAHMNPCIDCKILMLIKARKLMPGLGAQFIVTGEVLGQRPMSQHRRALLAIEQKSDLKGLLLRPLSAGNLIPTIPENKGWVDRKGLMSISGRSRKAQINLAKELGIKDYPNASGGCLLTDRQFSIRLKDLMSHQELNLRNIKLLKSGRHFRIDRDTKLIVGRSEKENKYLEEAAQNDDYLFMPEERIAGPTCLGVGKFSASQIAISAAIACRYFDPCPEGARVVYRRIPGKDSSYLYSIPAKDTELEGLRV